jgi:surfeit locus 1 family protein
MKQRLYFQHRYQFKQSLFVSLITIVAIAILCQLGLWQIQRAEEKLLKVNFIKKQQQKSVIKIDPGYHSLLESSQLQYQTIQITGYFEPSKQFYLDNKKYQGKIGYEIITPFRLENSAHYLLINRGWIVMGKNRNQLPIIETPSKRVVLSGTIMRPPQKHYRPGINKPNEGNVKIWLYLDTDYYSQKSGYSVYPLILLLDKHNQYGFTRQWPKFKAKSTVHYAFAMQWFAFALFFLISYFYIGFKKIDNYS